MRAEAAISFALPPLYTVGASVSASFLDMWQHVPETARLPALIALGVTAVGSLALVKEKRPFRITREDAIQRLDTLSGDPNRPASTFDKGLHPDTQGETREIWNDNIEHSLKGKIEQIRIPRPNPNVSRYNKLVAASIAVSLGITWYMAGEERLPRLMKAFDFTAPEVIIPPAEMRAWITEPEGIEGSEAIFLKTTLDPIRFSNDDNNTKPTVPVYEYTAHEQSELHMLSVGGTRKITVNGTPIAIAEEIEGDEDSITYSYEPQILAKDNYIINIENGPSWNITISPDATPTIEITDIFTPRYDENISIKCKASDDHGIKHGEIILRLPNASNDAAPPAQALIPPMVIPGTDFCN